jgi:hypothetical protein
MNDRIYTWGQNVCRLLCCRDVTNLNELFHVAMMHNSSLQIKPHVPPSRSIEFPHSTLIIKLLVCRDMPTGHFK